MKPTLIIVEDVKGVREKLHLILQDRFDIVAEASNGLEALEVCLRHHPQFVLMDVVMPTMSGLDASREILDKLVPPPKIVILSGFRDEALILEAYEMGVTEYLYKPIEEKKILETMTGLIPS